MGYVGEAARPIHPGGSSTTAAFMFANTVWANAFVRCGVRVNCINPGLGLAQRLRGRLQALAPRHNTTPVI